MVASERLAPILEAPECPAFSFCPAPPCTGGGLTHICGCSSWHIQAASIFSATASPWPPLGPRHCSQCRKGLQKPTRQGFGGSWVPRMWSKMRVLGMAELQLLGRILFKAILLVKKKKLPYNLGIYSLVKRGIA